MPIAIPARIDVVITGDKKKSSRTSTSRVAPPNLSRKDTGSAVSSTSVANCDRASRQKRLIVKTVLHQTSHRRTVRAGTP